MRPKKIVITEPVQVYNLVGRVNRDGIKATAEALDCNPTVLTRWLKEQGFQMIRRWETRDTSSDKKVAQHVS